MIDQPFHIYDTYVDEKNYVKLIDPLTVTKEEIFALDDEAFRRLHSLLCSRARTGKRRKVTDAMRLSQMKVGEKRVFPSWSNAKRIHRVRDQARLLTGEPQAAWSGRTLGNGVKVTRVR